MMELRFHHRVRHDLQVALTLYRGVSEELGDVFFREVEAGWVKIRRNPRGCHFDASGLRRCNLERFPYHFLYDVQEDAIRVWVLRHDRREPAFGTRRFST